MTLATSTDKESQRKSLFIRANGPDGDSVPLLIIPPLNLSESAAGAVANIFSGEFTTIVNVAIPLAADKISQYAEQLLHLLIEQQTRRATLLGIGAGAAIAQALAVIDPKFVRRLVLFNAQTRMEPTLLSRGVDWLERFLPLGLPLRPLSADFDSRPMLHRIRCPVLVAAESKLSPFMMSQSLLLARKIPNAWLVSLDEGEHGAVAKDSSNGLIASLNSQEFRQILREFLEVPTKRPQKNV